MAHPLDGPFAKVERAKLHVESLENAADDWIAQKPYRTYLQIDLDNAWKAVRIEAQEPPIDLALMLGDCIHNLRSALDHFAWQCGLLKGTPDKECQFPIFSDEGQFLQSGMDMLRSVKVPEAVALIKSVQPYNKVPAVRSRTALSLIKTLSNIDKHRLMPVVLLSVKFLGTAGDTPLRAVNFGPYRGTDVLALAALDVPDERLQLDPRSGATVTLLPSEAIPPLSQGIIKALQERCVPSVEKVLRSSIDLGIFPPRPEARANSR